MHTTPRTALTALALAATAAGALSPAVAGAASGQSSTRLTHLSAGDRVPAKVSYSSGPTAYRAGAKLRAHDALLRTRVSTPAHRGLAVRLTCVSGFVAGYGFAGHDGLAVNGHPTSGRHSLVVRVQSAADIDHDGRFEGTLLALCQGARP